MQSQEKKVETRFSRSPDYRTIFASRIYGGERSDHFEMVVESVSTNAAESQSRGRFISEIVDEVSIKMTPEQAKMTYIWLGEHIATFEKKFRPIELKGTKEGEDTDVGFVAK